jgi:hypothetical protein
MRQRGAPHCGAGGWCWPENDGGMSWLEIGVTPDFKAKLNAHSMCVEEQVFTHIIYKMDTE